MNIKNSIRAIVLTLIIVFNGGLSKSQDEQVQNVNTVKALFIYNFTKHIEWPVTKMSSNRFTIIVFGNSAITEKLTSLFKDRKIFDKTVEIKQTTNPEEALNAHILFIVKGNGDKLTSFLNKNERKAVLVISEERKMPVYGVSINLFEKNEHMRFELNDQIIKREGLKVSNQLYELAAAAEN